MAVNLARWMSSSVALTSVTPASGKTSSPGIQPPVFDMLVGRSETVISSSLLVDLTTSDWVRWNGAAKSEPASPPAIRSASCSSRSLNRLSLSGSSKGILGSGTRFSGSKLFGRPVSSARLWRVTKLRSSFGQTAQCPSVKRRPLRPSAGGGRADRHRTGHLAVAV